METSDSNRLRRSQKNYTLALRLNIVDLVEKGEFTYKQAQKHFGIQGRTTVLTWLIKHGKLDCSKPIQAPNLPKSKETPIKSLLIIRQAS